jgi:hypothetical protein
MRLAARQSRPPAAAERNGVGHRSRVEQCGEAGALIQFGAAAAASGQVAFEGRGLVRLQTVKRRQWSAAGTP